MPRAQKSRKNKAYSKPEYPTIGRFWISPRIFLLLYLSGKRITTGTGLKRLTGYNSVLLLLFCSEGRGRNQIIFTFRISFRIWEHLIFFTRRILDLNMRT